MPIAFAIAAGMILAAPAGAQQTTNDYRPLFESLWSAVNEQFYDPHFRGADWAAIGARYRPRAAAARNDDDFAALAGQMLAELPSSHLYILRPATSRGAVGIGAETTNIDGTEIVTQVVPISDAWRQGLRPGDRLLAPDAVRGAIGTNATVEIESCDHRHRRLAIRRESALWPPEHPGFRWRQITTGAGRSIGYMRIDRFDDGAAGLADQAMEELGETNAIIIDLRANSGGNASALRLASYFGPGAEPGVILLARPYLTALGHPPTAADLADVPRVDRAYTNEAIFGAMSAHHGGAAFWTETVARPYRRPVFLLIGPDTGSAAEGFAWYMRVRTPARLIGRTTAGALLSSDRVEIGQGWRVVIPVHGDWGPDGQDYGDRAVPPHVTVSWTRADLCTGRDPDMEEALRRIEAPAS